jgi:hypothetical protein
MTTGMGVTYVLPIYVCTVILRSPPPRMHLRSRNKYIVLLLYLTLFRILFYFHGNSGSSVGIHVFWLEGRGALTRRHGGRLDRRGV